MVNLKYIGSPVGVNSTRALKAMCIPRHFVGYRSSFKTQMTRSSTEDEEGSG